MPKQHYRIRSNPRRKTRRFRSPGQRKIDMIEHKIIRVLKTHKKAFTLKKLREEVMIFIRQASENKFIKALHRLLSTKKVIKEKQTYQLAAYAPA